MKIFTFEAVDADCPVPAVARIWLSKAEGWHPVIFQAADAGGAHAAAERWITAELEKASAGKGKRGRPRKMEAAPDTAVIEDEPEEAV